MNTPAHNLATLSPKHTNGTARRSRLQRCLSMLPVAGVALMLPATASASVSVSTSLSNEDMAAALAPTFYFHPDEQYLPVTIDEFAQHSTLKDGSGNVLASYLSSAAIIKHYTTGSSSEYLEVSTSWATSTQSLTGHASGLQIYYNYVQHDGYTDFIYSYLTAYNGCEGLRATTIDHWDSNKKTRNFAMCNLGRHYGDWEHVTVRVNTSTGVVASVITDAHGDSKAVAHSTSDVVWSGTHPRIYVALNTHGSYVSEGYTTTYDLWNDSSLKAALLSTLKIAGVEVLFESEGLITYLGSASAYNVKVVDITTTSDLLDTSGGSFQVLDSTGYSLKRISTATGNNILSFKGSWGQEVDNSNIDGSVGNIPNIDDAEFTNAVQDLMDLGFLSDYASGTGPTGIYAASFWEAGESASLVP